MKHELPNGIALFLWENEIDAINLQETHIEIIRPSGRSLKISLSNSWQKNKAIASTSAPPAMQALPQNEETPPQMALIQSSDPETERKAKELALSFQNLSQDLHKALEKITLAQETNQSTFTTIQKEMATTYANLRERIQELEMTNENDMHCVSERFEDLEEKDKSLKELEVLFKLLMQGEINMPQGNPKKKKK